MECNKEEAIKAREFAERKLTEKDFPGSKKFVLKAIALFPELEGITQMLTTLEVYIASENKINGEIDWYGVLGVTPSADEDTVRKQYRKLALVLHPDKNKTTGAEGAFKILSEAWSLLSDKPKRLAYNQRRFSKGIQHNILNGFNNVSKRATSSAKVAKNTTRVELSSAPRPQPRTNTFWTICHKCKMHYEYIRIYLNNTLLCPNCRKPFHASETSPPANLSTKPNVSSIQQKNQKRSHITPNGTNNIEKLKRGRQVASCTESLLKKRKENDIGSNRKPIINSDFMQLDIGRLKLEKARTEVRKKLGEWHLEAVTKATEAIKNKENQKRKQIEQKEKRKGSVKGNTSGVYKNGVSSGSDTVVNNKKKVVNNEKKVVNDEKKVVSEPVVMNVPDSDFYDFDQDRTETSFNKNQVWAVYDDDDGMPRIYAIINKVISLSPFQVEISWLTTKTNSEFGPLKWVASGFYKTCGDFKSGKHETNKSLNTFSHKVDWSQGPEGNLCIYPKRGDVWALYRNWSSDWNEHTPDEIIHKYDMVEILGKYGNAVHVVPITKVYGFKTVFRKELNPDNVKIIPKEEMFRFSHQVPSHTLTYTDGQNVPIGCLELDPAATPLELLQISEEYNNNQQKKDEIKTGETVLKYSRRQHRQR